MFNSKQIHEFINKEYKEFALYTISSRGIPSFSDTLTPLQRLILTIAPTGFQKSLNLVGDAFNRGYHHGNSSVESGLARLARTYLNAENLLEGDGFFGTPINPDAASARYTSVRIKPKIKTKLDEYKIINNIGKTDYFHDPLNINFPVGLLNFTIGISVGFASRILPRKFEELEKFMNNKKADLKPYLQNYNGSIKQMDTEGVCWVFKGSVIQEKKGIRITDVPPFIKYKTFLQKISNFIDDKNFQIVTQNNSKDQIDILLVMDEKNVNQDIIEELERAVSIVVTENVTFVDENKVLEYKNVIDFLTDFRNNALYSKKLFLKKTNSIISEEIGVLNAKIEFINFMIGEKRKEKEIDKFLKKYEEDVKARLSNTKIREMSIENVENIKNVLIPKEEELQKNNLEKLKEIQDVISKTDFKRRNIVKENNVQIAKDFKDIEEFEDEELEENNVEQDLD